MMIIVDYVALLQNCSYGMYIATSSEAEAIIVKRTKAI